MSYDAGSRGLAVKALARKGFALPSLTRGPRVMTAPPTVTSGASETLAYRRDFATRSSSYPLPSSPRGGGFASFSRTAVGGTTLGIGSTSVVTAGLGAPGAVSLIQGSFWHYGSNVEIGIYNATKAFFKVDDEYVSLTPTVVTATVTWFKLAFGSAAKRRIDVVGHNLSLIGVVTDHSDMIFPALTRGPRTMLLGDSFTASEAEGWGNWFADYMGWDDVWTMGVGGTGYTATNGGASKTFRDRVASDIIPHNPDIVIVLGSVNDGGGNAATCGTEAAALVAQIKAALPDCLVIGGMNASGGVEKWASGQLDTIDALKAAYTGSGGVWLNPMELPIDFNGPAPSVTLVGAHALGRDGATPLTPPYLGVAAGFGLQTTGTVSVANNLPIACTVDVGTGATRERLTLQNHTQIAPGNQGHSGGWELRYAHSAAEPVTQVGPAFMTGIGNAGAPTSWGNADLFVSADGVHPTLLGHKTWALVMAWLLCDWLAQRDQRARMTGPGFAA